MAELLGSAFASWSSSTLQAPCGIAGWRFAETGHWATGVGTRQAGTTGSPHRQAAGGRRVYGHRSAARTLLLLLALAHRPILFRH